MHQTRSDSNAESTASRRNRRPAFTVIAGLIAVAVGAVVVVEERGGYASDRNDAAYSSVVPIAATSAEGLTSATNTMSAGDSVTPHFERSEEPANDDDSVHPYGG